MFEWNLTNFGQFGAEIQVKSSIYLSSLEVLWCFSFEYLERKIEVE